MQPTEKVTVLALSVLLSLQLSWSAGAAPNYPLCKRVELEEHPLWISSATWIEDRSQLIVVDPVQNKILAYSSSGQLIRVPDIRIKGAEDFLPNAISRADNSSFLLELSDSTLVRLDREFYQVGGEVAPRVKSDQGFEVGSLYQWTLAGNSLFAYGTILRGDSAVLGFFRVPLEGKPTRPELLMPFSDNTFYLIGNSYITTSGESIYYVSMGKRPAIYEVPPDGVPHRLQAFPAEFRIRPDFKTEMKGPVSAVAHLAELETFSVVCGLYAQSGMLYVLARKPGEAGETAWYLYKIDPKRDKVVGSMRLPTSAHHLTVVPSKDAWYLLERGVVQGGHKQSITKMVVLDSSAVQTLSQSLSACPSK
jgi:hypothetical protein